MESESLQYITIGIWIAAILLGIYLFKAISRVCYRTLIRPWRSSRLTMRDLRNRRKYKSNPEGIVMKLTKLTIWIAGLIFSGLMIWGIAVNIKHNFDRRPMNQNMLELLSLLHQENIEQLQNEVTIENAIAKAGSTREALLEAIDQQIIKWENAEGGISALDAKQQAEYTTLRLVRDVLNGKVPSNPSTQNATDAVGKD